MYLIDDTVDPKHIASLKKQLDKMNLKKVCHDTDKAIPHNPP